MSKKRMAFWKYDLFPYMLWAEVNDKIVSPEKDAVYVDAYQGFVKPVFVLNNADGKLLSERLASLKSEKREIDTAISERYTGLVNSAINEFASKNVGCIK